MKQSAAGSLPNPTSRQVVILAGKFAGHEGFCLGPAHDGLWAVTPDGSTAILALKFDSEFGVLINSAKKRKDAEGEVVIASDDQNQSRP